MDDSLAFRIGKMPKREREKILRRMVKQWNAPTEDIDDLRYLWEMWARTSQKTPEGKWISWLLLAGRGFGKMTDVDDVVRTPGGWKRLGDVVAGDVLFGLDGKPCNVLAAHEPQVKATAYRLYFDTGETIIADPEHLWYTISKNEEKRIRRGKATRGSVKTTQQVVDTLKHLGRETNHRVPVCAPLSFAEKPLPIKPYSFGQWLGDGDSNGFSITTEDAQTLIDMQSDGYTFKPAKCKPGNRYTFSNGVRGKLNGRSSGYSDGDSLYCLLKYLNVYKNKHIPQIYKDASIAQRTELLQGLMDSDGHCQKSGWCEFCSVSKTLANDVFELASGLGIKARMYTGRATISGKDCGVKYRVMFKTDLCCFKLARKAAVQKSATKAQMSRHRNRFIVGAEEVRNVEMRCLTVDSADNLFLVGKSLIATHNTRVSVEQLLKWEREGYKRFAIVAQTPAEARDVLVEGESGILQCAPPWNEPKYEPSKRRITWPSGAIATIYSGENPELLRGPQHDKAIVDELAKYKYPQETWDNLMLGLRLGDNPQVVVATTPKPIKTVKDLVKDPHTVVTTGSTYENRSNLADAFIETVIQRFEGTRLGRQELYADILDDNPNALWTRKNIDAARVQAAPENLQRIVVGVDPAVTSGDEADDTGIIVAGTDGRDFYVLEDKTLKATPDGWAREAVKMYHKWKADRIIGEANNGGDMIEFVIRSVDRNVSYKKVHATRGKLIRAEPIAALYEQGKVHHVGYFGDLEDQYCEWQPGDKSPNNMDAAVWALTELSRREGVGVVRLGGR